MISTTIYKDIKGQQLNDLLTIISQHCTKMSVARYCDSIYSDEDATENLEIAIKDLRNNYDKNIDGIKDQMDMLYNTPTEVHNYFDEIYQIGMNNIKMNKHIEKQKSVVLIEEVNCLSDLKDYITVEYTNSTPVTNGPRFEVVYFKIGPLFKILQSKLPSLFTFPYEINGNCYEDIAFYNDDQVVMAVCSHENFAVLNLNDEIYELISQLNILD